MMNDKERYLSTQRRVEQRARMQNIVMLKGLSGGLLILMVIAGLVTLVLG
jgi:hypothetical protein